MMKISCLSKADILTLYEKGKEIEDNTFEIKEGLPIHFSDEIEMNKKLELIGLKYVIENEKQEWEKNVIGYMEYIKQEMVERQNGV
jgi:hypothetical protein